MFVTSNFQNKFRITFTCMFMLYPLSCCLASIVLYLFLCNCMLNTGFALPPCSTKCCLNKSCIHSEDSSPCNISKSYILLFSSQLVHTAAQPCLYNQWYGIKNIRRWGVLRWYNNSISYYGAVWQAGVNKYWHGNTTSLFLKSNQNRPRIE